jgi:hypothetical protein
MSQEFEEIEPLEVKVRQENRIAPILWPFMAGICTASALTLFASNYFPAYLRVASLWSIGISLSLTALFLTLDLRHTQEDYWFVELWIDNRKTFIEFIKHSLFFAFLAGAIWGFDEILTKSNLTIQKKGVLDDVHFYGTLVALVIFGGSFIIKVLVLEYRGFRK